MRTFAQRQIPSKGKATSDLARRNTVTSKPIHHSHPILRLQSMLGNQAVQRLLQTKLGDLQARSSTNGVTRFAYDFQRFFDGKAKPETKKKPEPEKSTEPKKKSEPEKPPSREPCDNKCGISGGSFGNTECEIDLKPGGTITGGVKKEIFDKNPCTRPCVEVHEDVHAKKIKPICADAKKCVDAAGEDWTKKGKCLDKMQADMDALTFSTECAAYTAEEECLSKRAKKAECKSTDGKKRFDEQMKMVKCYKDCFCKG